MIEKYLQIQHKLYGNKIIIDRDEPEDFPDNNYVLKTFLLSMVENAFRHGLVLNGEQIWQISISYKLKPNTFYVEIQDNGKGFDTQLKRTRGALSKFDDTIENLKKYNQNKPCITYEYLSSPGMGTTVKIEILLDYNYESPSTQKSLYASVISMVKGN